MRSDWRRAPGGLLLLPLIAGLLAGLGCRDETGDAINPDDLLGTWVVVTNGLRMTFELGEYGQIYQLRDPQGAYSHLSNWSELMAHGFWLISGASLLLEDEGGSVACWGATDRYVLNMDAENTIMTLTHLGDECLHKAFMLTTDTWWRVTEESN